MASQQEIPADIQVIVGVSQADDRDLEFRGPSWKSLIAPQSEPIKIEHLHGQVNIFLQQLDVILSDAKKEVGGFKLSEIEISAGIVVKGEGEITLALIANAQVGGELNAGIRFVFKRE